MNSSFCFPTAVGRVTIFGSGPFPKSTMIFPCARSSPMLAVAVGRTLLRWPHRVTFV